MDTSLFSIQQTAYLSLYRLPTISVDPYDLVFFEEKGTICKVIAAMLISTKPPLIPGINHYCLWSLAPASTMVRLRH